LWGLAQFTSGVDSVFPGVPGARYWTEVSTCPAEFTAHAPLLLLVQVQLMPTWECRKNAAMSRTLQKGAAWKKRCWVLTDFYRICADDVGRMISATGPTPGGSATNRTPRALRWTTQLSTTLGARCP